MHNFKWKITFITSLEQLPIVPSISAALRQQKSIEMESDDAFDNEPSAKSSVNLLCDKKSL